jgi:N-formylglutamate amidohydrolase
LILHIPHASTDIGDVSYNISGDDLKKELFESTDWFTDELFIYPKVFRLFLIKVGFI